MVDRVSAEISRPTLRSRALPVHVQVPALDEAVYVCRKGFHAINVQAVCDAQLRFTNIIVQWPGSTHDSHIFNNCNLKRHLEEGKYDIWLLGDSGKVHVCPSYLYPTSWPLSNEKEEKYNRCHIGTRYSVERATQQIFNSCFNLLMCLHKSTGCLLFSPEKSIKIITACFQLHNLAILLRLPEPDVLCETPGPEVDSSPADNHNMDGCRVRGNLINTRF
ncbi:putative nuclease HARBI1 [Haliotis cracherodii]|uniref:putative nuclease HARBI1 n=1 Tax=Haliotis cracherodii TaxID=6455 RepID=UPI0039E7B522